MSKWAEYKNMYNVHIYITIAFNHEIVEMYLKK